MPHVVALHPALPVPAVTQTERLLSPKALAKQRVCEAVLRLADRAGAEASGAGIALFVAQWRAGLLPADVVGACRVIQPTKTGCPSRASLYRWLEQYRAAQAQGTALALAPKHQGRTRAFQGWEVRALHLYQQPQKPAAAEVARQLREEGQTTATERRVQRYLASLPSTVLETGRLGPRLRHAQGDYVARTTEGLAAGFCYVGDGHTIDCYLQHPTGRHPWRAELTVWLDWRSRCVAGWWISEAESGLTTLFSLSHAIQAHDHVPPMIHIDNGSGFKAQLHTDEATGFLARWGISPMHALPYNARSKVVERFFGTMERSFGKRWPSYCGDDMDEEARAAILKRFKKDPAALPTLAQYLDGLRAWLDEYHRAEHPEVDGKSRAQVWVEEFKPNPPGPGAGLWWPRVERIVSRRRVWLDGRCYRHAALDAFNKTALRDGKVWVEYDVHQDATVRVLTLDGRWICDAELVHKRAAIPDSRVVEAREKSERAAVKRLELHLQEVHDRAALVVDAGQSLRAIEDATGEVSLLTEELARGTLGPVAPAEEEDLDIWGEAP